MACAGRPVAGHEFFWRYFFFFIFQKKYEAIKENRGSDGMKTGGFYGKQIKTSGGDRKL